jgi:hypothetical protein
MRTRRSLKPTRHAAAAVVLRDYSDVMFVTQRYVQACTLTAQAVWDLRKYSFVSLLVVRTIISAYRV